VGEADLNPAERDDLIAFLAQFVTRKRRQKMNDVLDYRTRQITVVLEDIRNPQNSNAVMRSAECLGVQDIHLIENRYQYGPTLAVSRGATKWLSLHHYDETEWNTPNAYQSLRDAGYMVVATTPDDGSLKLSELPVDHKIALVFGNEEEGATPYAIEQADATLRLPMFGFTQSYNISVSAAFAISHLVKHLHASDIPWQLTENERQELKLDWYRKTIENYELVETRFYSERE